MRIFFLRHFFPFISIKAMRLVRFQAWDRSEHETADRKSYNFVQLLSANHRYVRCPVDQWECMNYLAHNLKAFLPQHLMLIDWNRHPFSVPSRDCRNANVCLFVCLFVCLSVCHKRFLVWTWINWWIHGYYIHFFYFRIKQKMWNEWTCKMNSTVY